MKRPCGAIDRNTLQSSLTRSGLDIRITWHNCTICTLNVKRLWLSAAHTAHHYCSLESYYPGRLLCLFDSMLHPDSYDGRGRAIHRHVQADVPHGSVDWRCSWWEYLWRVLPLYNHLWVKIFPSPFSSRENFWRAISGFVLGGNFSSKKKNRCEMGLRIVSQ